MQDAFTTVRVRVADASALRLIAANTGEYNHQAFRRLVEAEMRRLGLVLRKEMFVGSKGGEDD
jgi:molybdate-binding protein